MLFRFCILFTILAKMRIRNGTNTLKQFSLPIGKVVYRLLKTARHFGKLTTNEKYRSKYITNWKFGRYYFQKDSYTVLNRYPVLFAECQNYLCNTANPRILSFGCSSGEEVFTLGLYFPNATIIGIDINSWCLKQCKKKNTERRFSFYHRLSEEYINSKNFDIVFCLAVFQRTENRTETDEATQGFTFNMFEEEILILDKKLKSNGLFVIDNTDFSFLETSCSAYYRPLEFEKNKLLRPRPLFNRQNQKTAEVQENYRVFVKL